VDRETKRKIRFLENRGWYKDISGNYSHMAYTGLTRSLEKIRQMDWESLYELEAEMKKYVSYNEGNESR